MQNFNKDVVKELIKKYESLENDEKEEVTKKIKEKWYEVCDKFIKLCESDETVTSAYDELKKAGF